MISPVASRKLFKGSPLSFNVGGVASLGQPPVDASMAPVDASMAPPPMAPPPVEAATLPPTSAFSSLDELLAQTVNNEVTDIQQQIDGAETTDDLLNVFGEGEVSEETVRQDLAEIVGIEDANATPESVLPLLQPMFELIGEDITEGGLGSFPMFEENLVAPSTPMLASEFNPVAGFADGDMVDVYGNLEAMEFLPSAPNQLTMTSGDISYPLGEPFIEPLRLALPRLDYENIQEKQRIIYDQLFGDPVEARRERIPSEAEQISKLETALEEAGVRIEPRKIAEIAAAAEEVIPPAATSTLGALAVGTAGKEIIESKKPGFFEALMAGIPAVVAGASEQEKLNRKRDSEIATYALETHRIEKADEMKQTAATVKSAVNFVSNAVQDVESMEATLQRVAGETAIKQEQINVELLKKEILETYAATNSGELKQYIGPSPTGENTLHWARMTKSGPTVWDEEDGRYIPMELYRKRHGRLVPYEKGMELPGGATKDATAVTLTIPMDNSTALRQLQDWGVLTPDRRLSDLEYRLGYFEQPAFYKSGRYFITDSDGKPQYLQGKEFNGKKVGKITELAKRVLGEDGVTRIESELGISGTGRRRVSGMVGTDPVGGTFNEWMKETNYLRGGFKGPVRQLPEDFNVNVREHSQWITRPGIYREILDENGNPVTVVEDGSPFIIPVEYDENGIPIHGSDIHLIPTPSWESLTKEDRNLIQRRHAQVSRLLYSAPEVLNIIGDVVGLKANLQDFIANRVSPLTWGDWHTHLTTFLGDKDLGGKKALVQGWLRELIRSRMLSPRYAVGEQKTVKTELVPEDFMEAFLESPERGRRVFSELIRRTMDDYNYTLGVLKNKDVYHTPHIPSGERNDPFDRNVIGTMSHIQTLMFNVQKVAQANGQDGDTALKKFFENKFIYVNRAELNKALKKENKKPRIGDSVNVLVKMLPLLRLDK